MAKLIKVVRVRGNLAPRVQGGLDRKLSISKEGNNIILLLQDLSGNPLPPYRITYTNTPLSEINTAIAKYLAGPQNFQVIQDPFDPNVIPFQEITPEPPTPAPSEFETAQAEATTPEQIDALKQQFCPTPDQLQRLIDTRNNIVGQLNSIGTKLSTLNFSIGGLQDVTNTLKSLLSSVETTKLAASAAAKVVPVIPGAVPALLSDLETIDDKVLPLLEKNSGSINATAVPTAVVTSIINKIVNALGQLDSLILLCNPNSILDTISDTIIQTANNQNQADVNDGSYKGFTFQIEEVPFSPTVTRKRALALNQSGITLLQTELSFTANNQTLIDELKLIIDRDDLKAF